MSLLLLTYDLNKEKNKDDYEAIYDLMKKYDHFQLSESSYALESDLSPEEINRILEKNVDQNDKISVITLSPPFDSYSQEAQDWLNQRL